MPWFEDLVESQRNPALECGIDPNDGLIVAYLPKLASVMQEARNGDYTAYSQDGLLIDLLTEPASRVKWWKVRRAASDLGLAIVEPVWHGRAGDFRMDRMPEVPRPEPEWQLHMRAYGHGPWINIEPEQLKLTKETK